MTSMLPWTISPVTLLVQRGAIDSIFSVLCPDSMISFILGRALDETHQKVGVRALARLHALSLAQLARLAGDVVFGQGIQVYRYTGIQLHRYKGINDTLLAGDQPV